MSSFVRMNKKEGLWFFPVGIEKDVSEELARKYQSAEPFPHIVIDDFINAEALEELLSAFPAKAEQGDTFMRDQEYLKSQFHPMEARHAAARHFFNELNSDTFLRFLEKLTGISPLIPDPYFAGGGFHETRSGGKLGVHADFNIHQKLGLERRLNLLIYLNKEWKEEYGGCLELWDSPVSHRKESVEPKFGRAVLFSTGSDTFHGHPDPLTTPADVSRRSIALYYYSIPRTTRSGEIIRHTTLFEPRPGSSDKRDWSVQARQLAKDIMPPVLYRLARRLVHPHPSS